MATAEIAPPAKSSAPLPGVPIRLSTGAVIPPGIVDLESFRRWARSDACPEKARIAFYHDEIWMDPTMEQAYTHNLVKFHIGRVLADLADQMNLGHYFTDGMLLTNVEAGFTTIPDGIYVTYESLDTGRVVEVAGAQSGCVEFVGTPEMVLDPGWLYRTYGDRQA